MADPFFANVVYLALNDNQADGSTTFDDQSTANRTITAVGNAQYDTGVTPPSGMTSTGLFDGAGDRLTTADAADIEFGASDWVIECLFRVTSVTGAFNALMSKAGGGSTRGWNLHISNANVQFTIYDNQATPVAIVANSAIGTASANTWHYVCIARSGNTGRKWLGGDSGTATRNATNIDFTGKTVNDNNVGIWIADNNNGDTFTGNVACVRITIGSDRGLNADANVAVPTFPFETDSGGGATGQPITKRHGGVPYMRRNGGVWAPANDKFYARRESGLLVPNSLKEAA